jgi:hypothetical protein
VAAEVRIDLIYQALGHSSPRITWDIYLGNDGGSVDASEAIRGNWWSPTRCGSFSTHHRLDARHRLYEEHEVRRRLYEFAVAAFGPTPAAANRCLASS